MNHKSMIEMYGIQILLFSNGLKSAAMTFLSTQVAVLDHIQIPSQISVATGQKILWCTGVLIPEQTDW